MTYHLHMHNSGYYGRRSFNRLSTAIKAALKWFERGGSCWAQVEDKNGRGKFIAGFNELTQAHNAMKGVKP